MQTNVVEKIVNQARDLHGITDEKTIHLIRASAEYDISKIDWHPPLCDMTGFADFDEPNIGFIGKNFSAWQKHGLWECIYEQDDIRIYGLAPTLRGAYADMLNSINVELNRLNSKIEFIQKFLDTHPLPPVE